MLLQQRVMSLDKSSIHFLSRLAAHSPDRPPSAAVTFAPSLSITIFFSISRSASLPFTALAASRTFPGMLRFALQLLHIQRAMEELEVFQKRVCMFRRAFGIYSGLVATMA